MTKQPLFSVLIANYNNGKYLMDAIESVRQQTYTNWEIILVDDGSTDNSRDLYQELESDPRIHIYYNEKNMGCGYTKARCADLATGEVCGFLDPDDALLPEALIVTVNALIEHPKAAITMSRFYFCDQNLNIQYPSRLLQLKEGETYLSHQDFQPEVFSGFLRSAYKAAGGLDITLAAGVDQDLNFRLEEQGDIVILSEITYKYRRNPNSVSNGKNEAPALYWNTIARYKACERRHIAHFDIAGRGIINFVQMYINEVEKSRLAYLAVHNSWSYRLGKAILRPFSWIKRKILAH